MVLELLRRGALQKEVEVLETLLLGPFIMAVYGFIVLKPVLYILVDHAMEGLGVRWPTGK